MTPRCQLSVIILTYNEAENIADCLRSVDWADEVLIVDSGSTDQTLKIAMEHRPEARLLHHSFVDFGDQRNWALNQGAPRHHWVLFLDADERATPLFRDAIMRVVGRDSPTVGYYLTYRNMFLGRWIKHSTFYPSWQLRLLRQPYVCFAREGHGQREIATGPLEYLPEPYDHFPFNKGIAHWLDRHNRYSTTECELVERMRAESLKLSDLFHRDAQLRRRCLKRIAARVWCRPFLRFLYTYVWKLGFLDGMPGYIYCRLIAQYEFQLWAKQQEARAAQP
jgi:glycosyltransferase involved in cell wall biosynthesis